MNKKAIFSSGDKGGVGKTKTAIDYVNLKRLYNKKAKIKIVDTDVSNDDVYRAFKELGEEVQRFDISQQDGVMELINYIDTVDNGTEIVVNLPAGAGRYLRAESEMIIQTFESLDIDIEVIWSMGRSTDSISLLKQFMAVFGEAAKSVNVLTNGFFGGPEEFYRWNNSNLKTELEKNEKVRFAHFPNLKDRITVTLEESTNLLNPPITAGLEKGVLRAADKFVLERYIKDARAALLEK